MCLVSWKYVWILVSVLGSGKCFWIPGRVLDSGICFVPTISHSYGTGPLVGYSIV